MTQKKFDAVGIGLNSVDQFCVVNEYPQANTKSGILEMAREGGGQAATTMVGLARLWVCVRPTSARWVTMRRAHFLLRV